jgi:hypothetical protein
MKKLVLLTSIMLVGISSAFAGTKESYSRITQDPVILSVIQGVEKKHPLKCQMPTEESVQWTEMAGIGYNYKVTVYCGPRGAQEVGFGESMSLEIEGFDGGVNSVDSIKFIHIM